MNNLILSLEFALFAYKVLRTLLTRSPADSFVVGIEIVKECR